MSRTLVTGVARLLALSSIQNCHFHLVQANMMFLQFVNMVLCKSVVGWNSVRAPLRPCPSSSDIFDNGGEREGERGKYRPLFDSTLRSERGERGTPSLSLHGSSLSKCFSLLVSCSRQTPPTFFIVEFHFTICITWASCVYIISHSRLSLTLSLHFHSLVIAVSTTSFLFSQQISLSLSIRTFLLFFLSLGRFAYLSLQLTLSYHPFLSLLPVYQY